jgi:hypothetical protein
MKDSTSQHAALARDLAPAAVLPVQVGGQPLAARRSPERALMLAVLEDAIRCFAAERTTPSGRQRRSVREAESWLFDADVRWPFSFVNVCEGLELSPEAVRGALRASTRALSRLRVRLAPRRLGRMRTDGGYGGPA